MFYRIRFGILLNTFVKEKKKETLGVKRFWLK